MARSDENPDKPCVWPDGRPVTPWADPWHDVAGDLRVVSSLFRPMPPGEAERRSMIYRESGEITRELIARLLAGEFRE